MTNQELADQDVLNNGGCMVAGSWMSDKEIQLGILGEIVRLYGMPLGYEIVRVVMSVEKVCGRHLLKVAHTFRMMFGQSRN